MATTRVVIAGRPAGFALVVEADDPPAPDKLNTTTSAIPAAVHSDLSSRAARSDTPRL
jgi:hypothetical protein